MGQLKKCANIDKNFSANPLMIIALIIFDTAAMSLCLGYGCI